MGEDIYLNRAAFRLVESSSEILDSLSGDEGNGGKREGILNWMTVKCVEWKGRHVSIKKSLPLHY